MSRTSAILLVEDKAGDAALLSAALEEVDARIHIEHAVSPHAMMQALRKTTVDLIVLGGASHHMPCHTSLARIRRYPAGRSLSVMIMTDEEDQTASDDIEDRGLDGFLLKPRRWSDCYHVANCIACFLVAQSALRQADGGAG